MKRSTPVVAVLTSVLIAAGVAASPRIDSYPANRQVLAGEGAEVARVGEIPVSARAETTWFGSYEVIGGSYYARSSGVKADVMWTFDRGNGPAGGGGMIPDGEGWRVIDRSQSPGPFFRVIDSNLQLEQGVAPPIIAGSRSLWVGLDKPQADALCWPCGSGYANSWCERILSEPLAYNGSGAITLDVLYFNNSEPCFDGTQIYLLRSDNTETLLNATPSGGCPDNPAFEGVGGFTGAQGSAASPLAYHRVIPQVDIGGPQAVRFVIEFRSDPNLSDEDCGWPTDQGPFGCDDVRITGGGISKNYTFEDGLQGWVPATCMAVGDFVGVEDVGCYAILDPCACRLSGNVLEMHANRCDASPVHPDGQEAWVMSPVCDIGSSDLKTIFLEFDMYSEMPLENAVFLRVGWMYYPRVCEVTGAIGWSDRVGYHYYHHYGADPLCTTWRYGGTWADEGGIPIPADATKVVAILELAAGCEALSVDPCSGTTNFTPLLDNIAVGVTTASVNAPLISFSEGGTLQDVGSYPSALFDVRAPGPANTTVDKNRDNQSRSDKCGDSLVVSGPIPGADPNSRWSARMWWRVSRRGPFQTDYEGGTPTRYRVWRERVADGRLIDRPVKPQFTYGWMDSAQVGPVAMRNTFVACFDERDDDFVGEGNPENEMLWDDIFRPGTRIDYFITSNYINTPNVMYYFPDTTGGFFREFEVLPGVRTARVPNCGLGDYCAYLPATLYIDAVNAGRAQFYTENALRSLLNGLPPCTAEEGCEIPVDRNWDRYDYFDAASNTNAPFARGLVAGSNNGMTLSQILGYRTILFSSGGYGAGTTEDPDWNLFDQWLVSPDCSANTNRQTFCLNGDKPGEMLYGLPQFGAPFLTNALGAILLCDAFNGVTEDPDCAPEETSYCVRLLPVPGGPYGTLIDVDAWGSHCPNVFGFNVYTPTESASGNRTYQAESGPKTMAYAQVVRSNLAPGANYRTVVDGVSWHHTTRRDPGGQGTDRCPRTTEEIVQGSLAEIRAALRWGFGVADDAGLPRLANARSLGECQGTWWEDDPASGVGGDPFRPVDRLWGNDPNPFQPRTTVRFSTAARCEVAITIYDVQGRAVRALVSGTLDAGRHDAVWDGRDDAGRVLPAGVYWSQMSTPGYRSTRKMILLGARPGPTGD